MLSPCVIGGTGWGRGLVVDALDDTKAVIDSFDGVGDGDTCSSAHGFICCGFPCFGVEGNDDEDDCGEDEHLWTECLDLVHGGSF